MFRDEHSKETGPNSGLMTVLFHLLFSPVTQELVKQPQQKFYLTQLEVNDLDVLEINASSTNVEDVRDKIVNFCPDDSFWSI